MFEKTKNKQKEAGVGSFFKGQPQEGETEMRGKRKQFRAEISQQSFDNSLFSSHKVISDFPWVRLVGSKSKREKKDKKEKRKKRGERESCEIARKADILFCHFC